MLSSDVEYAALISEAMLLVKGLLQYFAGLSDVFRQLAIAFDSNFDQDIASDLQAQWLAGYYVSPEIEVRSQSKYANKVVMPFPSGKEEFMRSETSERFELARLKSMTLLNVMPVT